MKLVVIAVSAFLAIHTDASPTIIGELLHGAKTLLSDAVGALTDHKLPSGGGEKEDLSAVGVAFVSSGISPDVIPIPPYDKIEFIYSSGVQTSLGNELTPTQVKDQPNVSYEADPNAYYALILFDPDNYNGSEPVYREYQHWVVVNIPGGNVSEGEVLSEYIGSGPLNGTGLHRYTIVLYQQQEKMEFDEKRLDNKSITGRGGFSTKKFAEKNTLGNPVAGNFYRCQYDSYVPVLYKMLGAEDLLVQQ